MTAPNTDAPAVAWRSVPVEPTEAMLAAGNYTNKTGRLDGTIVAQIYRAMLSAAPAPDLAMREAVARIVARDLARQDYVDDWTPDEGWDLTWGYVDQGCVDFGEIADAILALLSSARKAPSPSETREP